MLVGEQQMLEDRTLCHICKERPVHCIYLPCGHVIACQQCAERATECATCKTKISATANVYLT